MSKVWIPVGFITVHIDSLSLLDISETVLSPLADLLGWIHLSHCIVSRPSQDPATGWAHSALSSLHWRCLVEGTNERVFDGVCRLHYRATRQIARMQRPLNKYESTDSVVFLDPYGRRSSTSTSRSPMPSPSPTPTASSVRYDKLDPTAPLTIALSLRIGRIVLLTVVGVGGILGLMFVFHHGVEVKRFESSQYDQAAQQKLLDDYNSYSGNVSSAFGKPIEMLVPLLVQIFMLRFMATAFTQSDTTFKRQAVLLVLTAGVGYLISNGFNAVNVQLRPQGVRAVISASDLTVGSDLNATIAAATTTVTKTVSELTPGNLISNTVLRNAVLPRVTLKQKICDYELSEGVDVDGELPLPTVDYGFTQRDWQKRLLQRALEPQTLRVVVNATEENANKAVDAADFPVNATTAADLLLYALTIGPNFFSWGNREDYLNKTEFNNRWPPGQPIAPDRTYVNSAARHLSLLPSSREADETTQREFFLQALQGAVNRQFSFARNTSRNDIVVEFSRVAVTSDIIFEAVTLEFDLDPMVMATNYTDGGKTRFTDLRQAKVDSSSNCGPWPALCFVPKTVYKGRLPSDYEIDALQRVHAFGSCMNANRTDELMVSDDTATKFDCLNISDSSMMIMSVGKRLLATSFEQNKTVLWQEEPARATEMALLTNLRKVYTFTIGRLSWKLQNLSSTFDAECGADVMNTKCMGLQVPLSSSLSDNGLASGAETSDQRLVVSADALPVNLLELSTKLDMNKPRAIPLVQVSESPYQFNHAGDILLPHNAGKITWTNVTVTSKSCGAEFEAHLFTRLNNHLYIEHSFQAAYTAATFFLLQNGVVKDTIPLSNSQNVTLNFDKNLQDVVLWVSTPFQNAMLSVAGCAVLVLGLIFTTIKTMTGSTQNTDPLTTISTPQAIARVMLDDSQFPSLLLHRRVVDDTEAPQPLKIDKFAIAGVTLEHTEERQRFAAIQ